MPVCAYLNVDSIDCPACGSTVDLAFGQLLFQWGYCPARHPEPERAYDWGDAIRWRLDDAGQILPWVYFSGVDQGGGNIGDPQFANVRIRAYTFAWEDISCGACGAHGVDILVEHGILKNTVAVTSGCEISLIEQDGRISARPEWDDHPMTRCLVERRFRLVVPDTDDPPSHGPERCSHFRPA